MSASSREYQGKIPLFHDSMHTGADGRFTLDLPVSRKQGQMYDLRTTHRDYVSALHSSVLLSMDEVPEQQLFQLMSNTQDLPGHWQLDLYLVDENGAPIAGAQARVMRHVRHSASTWEWLHEDRAASDANGHIVLEGDRLGEKRVHIDPSRQGWQTRRVDLGIDRVGTHESFVQLVPGLVVEGTVATVDGSPLPTDLQVIVTGEDTNEWRFAELGHGGQFRYEGLDPGVFTLRVFANSWSPVFLRDQQAGSGPLTILIKPKADDRDVGTHMAELHGVTRDALTGVGVPSDEFDIDAIEIWDEDQLELPTEELLAIHRKPRPVQRMADDLWTPPTPEFHNTGLRAGRYLLVARIRGYAPKFYGPFDLADGDLRAGIELELERGGELTGRVVDAAGQGVKGAHLYLAPDSAWGRRRLQELDHLLLDEGERSLHECERAAEDGTFHVSQLPTGQPYLLCALSREHAPVIVGRVEWRESGEVLKREFVMQSR